MCDAIFEEVYHVASLLEEAYACHRAYLMTLSLIIFCSLATEVCCTTVFDSNGMFLFFPHQENKSDYFFSIFAINSHISK